MRLRFLLAGLAAASSLSAQAGRPLAIEDYYRIRTVGAPQLAPDGRWVAFTLSRRIEATNGDSSEVWLVPADGSADARRVSPPGRHATNPSWREHRLRFRYAEQTVELTPGSSDSLVFVAPAPPEPRGQPVPISSPDGKRSVFLRPIRGEPPKASFASDFEKRHADRFRGVQFDWLDFQRDGGAFPVPNPADPTVNPPQEIFLRDSASLEARQLTRLGLRPSGLAWNPAGTLLVFTADSSYRDELRYEHGQVWTVALDGAVRRLSADLDSDYSGAAWSPDGKWVLTTRQLSTDAVIARKLNHGGPTDLVLLPVAGGAERVLTGDWDYLPGQPRWSRDGRHVYFTGGIGGTTHLFRVAVTGGAVEQITRGERRLAGFSFDSGMTRMAFTVGLMESPPDIWIADVTGGNERRLTSLHAELTSEIALSKPERLQFRSKDGTPIEGWLWLPHGYRAGDRAGSYPLVVFSHGGPHSATGYGLDFKLQYFAANGYFVLATNFRSSTGYGEQFLWATWGGWGNKDGEDVMAGVDHVIGRYPIDPKRVATAGHSYGGFMSNWLITQYPERFAAALVGAGIVNWVSDYGTADIARTKETEFFGTPWDPTAQALMMRQSPLTYANRVKAATLFVHGEVDQRVPYSEAEQMFVALKKNGIPTKMIQYAGQAHGISGHWNVVHRMLNERAWLDQWLKPAAKPATEQPR